MYIPVWYITSSPRITPVLPIGHRVRSLLVDQQRDWNRRDCECLQCCHRWGLATCGPGLLAFRLPAPLRPIIKLSTGQVLVAPINTVNITAGPTTQFTVEPMVDGDRVHSQFHFGPDGNFSGCGDVACGQAVLACHRHQQQCVVRSRRQRSAGIERGGFWESWSRLSPTGTPTGWLVPDLAPGALTIDGSNDLYFADAPQGLQSTSIRYYTSELEFSNTNHTGAYAVYDGGI